LYCAVDTIRKHPLDAAQTLEDRNDERVPNHRLLLRAGSAMMNRTARTVLEHRQICGRHSRAGNDAMQTTDAEELRLLAAKLTLMGSRVIWDGDLRIRSVAMFGEEIVDRDLVLLRQVPGLLELNLTRTNISDAGLFHVSKLSKLKILLLGGTDITDEGAQMLESLVELEQLNLTNTGITDSGVLAIAGMSKLEALWLDTTDITDTALGHLAEVKSLQLLDLRRTGVSDRGLKHLRGLRDLQELNLAGCQSVTPTGLAELTALQQLEWLCLDGTAVDADGLRHLIELPLKSISLNWTSLDNRALSWLERITPLTELRILGTQIDAADVERFRAARPDCSIHHCN
jgi:internalin A